MTTTKCNHLPANITRDANFTLNYKSFEVQTHLKSFNKNLPHRHLKTNIKCAKSEYLLSIIFGSKSVNQKQKHLAIMLI